MFTVEDNTLSLCIFPHWSFTLGQDIFFPLELLEHLELWSILAGSIAALYSCPIVLHSFVWGGN